VLARHAVWCGIEFEAATDCPTKAWFIQGSPRLPLDRVGNVRKLITWNLVTVDGFFEGEKSGDLAFHQAAWGPGLEAFVKEQLRSIGGLLFGRVTYEGMASYWQIQSGEVASFMNSVPKYVFSRTLGKVDWRNSRLVKGDPAAEVVKLKHAEGQDLFVFGSANLSSTLIGAGLVDEYRIGVTPILLGRGNPLFKASPRMSKLRLLDAKTLEGGCVILRYAPDRI
jgi:dihydrofolate reductase